MAFGRGRLRGLLGPELGRQNSHAEPDPETGCLGGTVQRVAPARALPSCSLTPESHEASPHAVQKEPPLPARKSPEGCPLLLNKMGVGGEA